MVDLIAAPGLKESVEEGPEGIQGYSPQLMKILERAAVKKLETLSLSSKELTWLPESIGLLTNLTSLDISGSDPNNLVPVCHTLFGRETTHFPVHPKTLPCKCV